MINKFITVISTIGFISCSSCQSDSKDSNKEIQTSHKSVDSLTTNDTSQFQRKHLHCLLDSLNLNDTLYITNVSKGCFHHSIDSIKIYYQSNKLYANSIFQYVGSEDKLRNSNFISDSTIRYYRRFEKHVKMYKPGNCFSTTHESFRINYKSTTIGFESSDPNLQEFDKLKSALFGKTKVDQLYSKLYHVNKNK